MALTSSTASLSEEDMKDLIDKTHFKKKQIQKWYKCFMKNIPSGKLNKMMFLDINSKNFRDEQTKQLFEQKFRITDQNKNSSINFKEFLEIMSGTDIPNNEVIKDPIEEIKNKITILETESLNNKEKISILERKLEIKEEMINQLKEKINTINIRTNEAVSFGEIYLIVDKFSEKVSCEEFFSSRPFYSHIRGYKLRIYMYPGGYGSGKGSYLTVGLIVCKGEYDDSLSWPFQYPYKMAIINQWTTSEYNAVVCKPYNVSAFLKPGDKDNYGVGRDRFISHKDLDSIEGLKVDDSVILKCSIKVPT